MSSSNSSSSRISKSEIDSRGEFQDMEIDVKDGVGKLKQMFPDVEDDVILSTLVKSGKGSMIL